MKQKKNETGQSLVEKINKTLDISPEALPGGTLISISGRQSIKVEGRVKILLYSPDKIVLALGKETLTVIGKRLLCSAYHGKDITLEGYIYSVSFEGDTV